MVNAKWILVLIVVLVLSGTVSAATLNTSQFGVFNQNISGYVDEDPLGGGNGYADIKTSGDCTATTSALLISCIGSVSDGQTIYIPETAEINMTGIYGTHIDTPNITVASNRGYNGSAGGLIYSIRTSGSSQSMLETRANGVRFTGLRIQGSDKGESDVGVGSSLTTGLSNYQSKDIEVDNCEIYGWNTAGIVIDGTSTDLITTGFGSSEIGSETNNIHHNYIHHIQMDGYGYGIQVTRSTALVKGNVFDYVREVVVSSGLNDTGFEMTYNLILGNVNQTVGDTEMLDVHPHPYTWGENIISSRLMRVDYNTAKAYSPHPHYFAAIAGAPTDQIYIRNNDILDCSASPQCNVGGGPVIQTYTTGIVNITMSNNIVDGNYIRGGWIYEG